MFSSDTDSRVFNWGPRGATKSKDSGLRLPPEWRLSVSAVDEIPAALFVCHLWRLDRGN